MSQRVKILHQRAEAQHFLVQGREPLWCGLRNLVDQFLEVPLQDRDRSADLVSEVADQPPARLPFAVQGVSHPVESTRELTEFPRSILRSGSRRKIAGLEPARGGCQPTQRNSDRAGDERRAEKRDRDRDRRPEQHRPEQPVAQNALRTGQASPET